MPTYEYVCNNCKNRFDRFQKFSDPPLQACEECGGELRRVFHPATIQFKGSGFYSTDNRRPGGSVKPKPGDKSSDSSAGGSTDSAPNGSSSESSRSTGSSSATKTAEKSA